MRALNRDGFVMSYVSSIYAEDYETDLTDRNQLRLEARLRKAISEKKPAELPGLPQGMRPYYSHGNIFVDHSSFYSTLNRVRMNVATTLLSDDEQDVDAILWSYMSTGAYLNGSLVAEIEHPVYKPIESVRFRMHLRKGRNDVVFLSDNLGVRDTRNMLAFQIVTGHGIMTTIPDENAEKTYAGNTAFLDGIKIEEGKLVFPYPAPDGAMLEYAQPTDDYCKKQSLSRREDISRKECAEIPQGIERTGVTIDGMTRRFEFSERIRPSFIPFRGNSEAHFRDIIERIANLEMLDRGDHGFAIFSSLARHYLNKLRPDENKYLKNDIDLIKRRGDCSDFLVCGLLRYIHEYGLPEELKADAKEALLNFRYWMTMKGADGMCFWSENHALMFYYSACDAGALYPDEYFPRAGMTGRELHAYGERRVDEWLDDVLESGYEEFLSSTYMCVTFAVLLNVIDYCKPSIAAKAWKATDRILEMLADSTFSGAVIAPMGRVYRGVIYPFREAVSSLINAVDEESPYAYGEGWISYLATSRYKMPEGLAERMHSNIEKRYSTGNAMVSVEKNESYMLTAVESPRTDSAFIRWKNVLDDDSLDAEDNRFVKSINECFHGTSCFQSGVYGYQQHMWSAALSAEAVVFANHPGTTSEDAELRPGYWNGNGVMPAIVVRHGELGAVYNIPENHPVPFTHLYLPRARFAECRIDGHWIFLREGKGYLAIWLSGDAVPYDDMIASSELRVYARNAAYYVRAAKCTDIDFDSFCSMMKATAVTFSEDALELSVNGSVMVHFSVFDDKTQYLD